jgi:hypothetical protein
VCVKESVCVVGFSPFPLGCPLLPLGARSLRPWPWPWLACGRVSLSPRSPRVCGVWCGLSFLRALESAVSSSSFASFVSSLPAVGSASAWVAAPVLPVAPPAPVAVSFVPGRVSVGARLVSSGSFVPAARGVVSACSASDPRGLVVVVGGRSFRCLWSALGGVGSPDAVALVAACRAARASGAPVVLWVAPGKSGLGCPGYFCGVEA